MAKRTRAHDVNCAVVAGRWHRVLAERCAVLRRNRHRLGLAHLNRWTRTAVMGQADFAAEVIADDSVDRDLVDKLRQYAELGVPEYLALDARPSHERFDFDRLGGDRRYRRVQPDARGRYHSEVLPGLRLEAAWFQQDPLPPVEQLLFAIAGDAYFAWLLRQREAGGGDR